jgi:acetolactate synthase I/II/III large subunit
MVNTVINIKKESEEKDKRAHLFTTGTLLVKCLECEGVKYVFGIPGEENLHVIDALLDSGIQFITTRHEQGAAFMADVYGRLTGNPGVCLSTLGPGATNLVTGVADANLDGAPLIAITGQVGTDSMHLSSHQYLDLVSLFTPITKWSKQIVRPDTVTEIVRKAFKIAANGKPGAVHIDLPKNIAAMPVEGNPIPKFPAEKSFASFASLEKAAAAISQAKNPLILSGNGSIRVGADKAITAFAQALKIPVANTFMGKGIIPFTSAYSLWTIGLAQQDYINQVLEETDLVIAIGYDLVEYSPQKWNQNGKIKIIHIGTECAGTDKYYQPAVEVIGDITDSVKEIMQRCSRAEQPAHALEIRQKMQTEYDSIATDTAFPMKPNKILYDVRKVMGEDDILISDVGAHKMWIARQYHCYKPNTCIISNGFASMGISIPGALAAKLVHPERQVLAVCGDGGFMMNCQELETARRVGCPFVTLIFNDGSYGLIKWKQQTKFGRTGCVDFTNPDFKMLAESMGLKGYRVENAEDLIPILKDAFAQQVPSVIDCPVDYSENLKLDEHLRMLMIH